MFELIQSRRFDFFIFFLSAALIGMAYYFELVEGMAPCPLCIFQRIGVALVGAWFLIRALHNPKVVSFGYLGYSVLILLSTSIGGLFAGRHAYLKSLPPEEVPPGCGAAVGFLFEVLEPWEVIVKVFTGGDQCTKDAWQLMGLSMPAWVFIFFAAIAIIALINIYNYIAAKKE